MWKISEYYVSLGTDRQLTKYANMMWMKHTSQMCKIGERENVAVSWPVEDNRIFKNLRAHKVLSKFWMER